MKKGKKKNKGEAGTRLKSFMRIFLCVILMLLNKVVSQQEVKNLIIFREEQEVKNLLIF